RRRADSENVSAGGGRATARHDVAGGKSGLRRAGGPLTTAPSDRGEVPQKGGRPGPSGPEQGGNGEGRGGQAPLRRRALGKPHPEQDRVGGRPGFGRTRMARPFPRVGRLIPWATGGPDEWLLLPLLRGRTESGLQTSSGGRFLQGPEILDSSGQVRYKRAWVGQSGAGWRIEAVGWGNRTEGGCAPRWTGCSAGTSSTRWTTRGGWPSRPASARRSPGSRKSASSSPSMRSAAYGVST